MYLPNNQTGVDDILQNCTKILGSLTVTSDYVGSLDLRRVTNITGTLLLSSTKDLTGLVAQHLSYLNYLWTIDLPAITLSLPAMEQVGFIDMMSQKKALAVYLPALETANSIKLAGSLAPYVNFLSPCRFPFLIRTVVSMCPDCASPLY